ncbi:MIP/aquaporin family protein [Desulfoluna spongiiphila]|uniref:Glycerol uptake facilitator protein n=1 Tax=Desulfoluna spongiiphila TaxID=419481 RepID=A0A1G5EPB3_9BACT|nr:MIP/aquaporin family protein [Desulfoluna spongiiphila]SCY28601.1 glycerol uptake facilitator protein [Desulfoluna spongiiphila]VVS91237.1 major intrinsic protein [Desulfoluna spongiiphila]
MSSFLGELIGTLILTLFGCGVVGGVVLNKSKAQDSGWIVITLGWGFAVAFAVYLVGKYSGAHVNPAVTLGLATIGLFPWADVPMYIAGQMIGAFIGATLVYLHYYPHWAETEDKDAKLAVFATGPAINNPMANLFSEILGTAILVFGLLGIGANKFSEGLNPLIVGFFIAAIGLSFGGTTGYAINPARDLGPRLAHFFMPIAGKRDSDWTYAWIPVVGPILGGVCGALLYKAIVM